MAITTVILFLVLISGAHLYSVFIQLKQHIYLDAREALSFVELRFSGYEETLSLLKNPPPYLKNPAWLVDEFQSHPFLFGVLIWDNQNHIILNSFPYGTFPDKAILLKSFKGIEKNRVFYLSEQIKSKQGNVLNVLVAIDTSFRNKLWKETLLHSAAVVCGGLILLGFLGGFLRKLLKKEEEMHKQLADAERLAAAGRFSAMLAHEVKNPLNTLSMGLQYLKETREITPDFIDTLIKQVYRLNELVVELMSIARGIKLEVGEVIASKLLAEIKEDFKPLAEARNINFHTVLEKDFCFQADQRWLARAIANLVKNGFEAVKSGGGVKLIAGQDEDKIFFEVIDNGKGIDKQQFAMVTRPFYTTKKHGFGMGLYLAEMVAKAHGGKLVIDTYKEGCSVKLIFNKKSSSKNKLR